jgi:hypothetical protein
MTGTGPINPSGPFGTYGELDRAVEWAGAYAETS